MRPGLDRLLMIATVIVLILNGLVFAYASIEYTRYSKTFSNWPNVPEYSSFARRMNSLLTPFLIALVVLLTLCIPKRLLGGTKLALANAIMIAIFAFVFIFRGLALALLSLVILAAMIQIPVVLDPILGRSGRFEYRSRLMNLGSGLIHLATLLFVALFILRSLGTDIIAGFYFSMFLFTIGLILVFYSKPLSRRLILRKKKRELEDYRRKVMEDILGSSGGEL